MHDLIRDITLCILFAWGIGLLAHFFKQPLILAYLVAGFFIGPTVQYMHVGVTTESGSSKADVSYTSYGAGVDLGGKLVMDNGFTLGGGLGLAYLNSSVDSTNSDGGSLLKFEGVLPRFLLDVGYAFDM